MKNLILARPDNPVLMQTAKPVPLVDITSSKTQEVINSLVRFALGKQEGSWKRTLVGLAGPQVRISKRIILVDVAADGKGHVGDVRVYINPEITWKSEEKNEWYEGCFSTDRVCGIVSRPTSVKIRAYTRDGKLIEEIHSGYTARIFQHEIDHLNGREFVMHINDPDNLHWVENDEFQQYRNNQAWRTWPKKCPWEKWEKIKGFKNKI